MFRSYNALYISAVALAVFVLGVAGLSLGGCALPSWQDRILDTLELFLHIAPAMSCAPAWPLVVARYAAPYIVPFVALFATLRLAFANLRHDIRVVRARYKRGHVVVCGLGETGMQILENLRMRGEQVSAIDLNNESPHAAAADAQGIPVLKGDASDRAILEFSAVGHARAVVICTGDDAANVDIALRILELAKPLARPGILTILVEMRQEWLFAKLIDHDKEPLGSTSVEVRPFNVNQNAARVLIQHITPQRAFEPEARPVVVIGFGGMGREVSLHLLRAAPVPLGHRVPLVILDRAGEELGRNFLAGLPRIEDFAEFTFLAAEIAPETTEKWKALEGRLGAQVPLAVIVCLPDDKVSLFVALEARALFDRLGHFAVPVFVRLRRHHRLGEFASRIEQMPASGDRLRGFGALEELLKPDILFDARLDRLAQACHRRYLDALPPGRRDAPNARVWAALPEHFKMSSRREADHIAIKLAQAGCVMEPAAAPEPLDLTPQEIELLARLEHRRWTIERRLRGWTQGPERDDVRLVNPYLVEWEALPEPVREDNRQSAAALPRLLAAAGLEIRRAAPADQTGRTSGR